MRFYIIKADNYYWFEFKDVYGKMLMKSIEYNTCAECVAGIALVKKLVPNAEIVEA